MYKTFILASLNLNSVPSEEKSIKFSPVYEDIRDDLKLYMKNETNKLRKQIAQNQEKNESMEIDVEELRKKYEYPTADEDWEQNDGNRGVTSQAKRRTKKTGSIEKTETVYTTEKEKRIPEISKEDIIDSDIQDNQEKYDAFSRALYSSFSSYSSF